MMMMMMMMMMKVACSRLHCIDRCYGVTNSGRKINFLLLKALISCYDLNISIDLPSTANPRPYRVQKWTWAEFFEPMTSSTARKRSILSHRSSCWLQACNGSYSTAVLLAHYSTATRGREISVGRARWVIELLNVRLHHLLLCVLLNTINYTQSRI